MICVSHSLVRISIQSTGGSMDQEQGMLVTTGAGSPVVQVEEHPLIEEKAALEAMNRELSQMILKMNNISG